MLGEAEAQDRADIGLAQAVVDAAMADARKKTTLPLEVVSSEEVTWRDASLGCPVKAAGFDLTEGAIEAGLTLTNLSEEDWRRIGEQHLSPLNVSVHATDPQLRVDLLRHPRAGAMLDDLRRLGEMGIVYNTQLVLNPGINDGEVLDGWKHPNGIEITRVRVPLGVVAIIYENRPNVERRRPNPPAKPLTPTKPTPERNRSGCWVSAANVMYPPYEPPMTAARAAVALPLLARVKEVTVAAIAEEEGTQAAARRPQGRPRQRSVAVCFA